MSTIPADVSLIAKMAPAKAPAVRRLPRLVGLAMSAVVAGALWLGLIGLVRLAL